jgi:hypothetical protein
MKSFEFIDDDFLDESGIGGLEYEQSVVDAIKPVLKKFKNKVKFITDTGATAGFNAHGIDLEIDVNGKPFNVEIKQSAKAQMGGTSVRYNALSDMATIVNLDRVDEEAQQIFVQAVKRKKEDIKKFTEFLRKQEPKNYHKKISDAMPISSVTTGAWEAAVLSGLLSPLNAKERFSNTNLIVKAYNSKDVYYIQIGGAGLFYLGSNPYDLPIPKFEGEIDIEFRLGAAGSTPRIIDGRPYKVRSANYRCQGRLITTVKSDLSLDNSEDVDKILSHIINFKEKNNIVPEPEFEKKSSKSSEKPNLSKKDVENLSKKKETDDRAGRKRRKPM